MMTNVTGNGAPTLLTISNLYPRPDRPHLGLFNAQLFEAFGTIGTVRNICLVPEWRTWRWRTIRAWRSPRPAPFETTYLPVFYVPLAGRSYAASTYTHSLRSLRPELCQIGSVYTAWLYPDGVAVTRVAGHTGASSWIMVQGSDTFHLDSHRTRRAITECSRSAGGFVCVSEELRARVVNAGVDPQKAHVVANGVDERWFHYRDRSSARSDLDRRYSDSERLILFVGNLVPVKGVEFLIDACARLQAAGDCNWSLALVGDGELRAKLARRVAGLGISDRVFFAGSRPHEEISQWMAAADCLCLPSLSEGMPNVLIEAMATGCPVVGTEVGACREITRDFDAAVLVPPGDVDALARALHKILETPHNRKSLAEQQRGRHSWGRQASTIWGLIFPQ